MLRRKEQSTARRKENERVLFHGGWSGRPIGMITLEPTSERSGRMSIVTVSIRAVQAEEQQVQRPCSMIITGMTRG